MNKETVGCCFCNESVESTYIDPCDLNILSNWDKPSQKHRNQTFWCHLECFREKLHKDVEKYLVLDLLSIEEE